MAKILGRRLTSAEKVEYTKERFPEFIEKLAVTPALQPQDPGGWKAWREVVVTKTYHRTSDSFHLANADRVVDFGMHKGYFAIFLANQYPHLSLTINGYEPDTSSFLEAERNAEHITRTSKKRIRVSVTNKAVSAEAVGLTEFSSEPVNSWRSCLVSNASKSKQRKLDKDDKEVIFVEVEAAKTIIRRLSPTVVKMDIEGADISILRDNSVDWSSVRLLMMEYSSAKEITDHGPPAYGRFQEVVQNLQRKGFVCFDIPNEVLTQSRWYPGHAREAYDFVMLASRRGVVTPIQWK